jgi:penicillin amidase
LTLNSNEILARLGAGESIASVCASTGWSQQQFNDWWSKECRRRVPADSGSVSIGSDEPPRGRRRFSAPTHGICARVLIRRDEWGVPHIEAANDADLFFGFGYASAQDRLFQLDWLRRKAHGMLAEILGPDGLESDLLYRTLGLTRIADRELKRLPPRARELLVAYTAGINAVIEARRDNLPIEFDLLGYQPELWGPLDCLAIAGEFCWYLTGRFPVIVIPELVKRALGDGPLYRAFLQGEAEDESILPGDGGAKRRRATSSKDTRQGSSLPSSGGGDEGQGSTNWVLAAPKTTTGGPIVASDPHVPFGAISIWHEVHLRGGSFNVAGVAYAGVPAVMIGRNERVAWGITNNICSLRDLYQEKTDPRHSGCFLYNGQGEPAVVQAREVIRVKGADPVERTVLASRNGPIVDDLLPGPARGQGPVALRWQGAEQCGWLTAMLDMNVAKTAEEFRKATKPWLVPTFNLVFADADGHIGHQCVGRIPLRDVPERGYRPGWDPKHQWTGTISFKDMPKQSDPPRGFVVTANNRLAPDDYPFPLSGTWSSGHRARRIREEIEARPRWSAEDCRRLQLDVRSGRAAVCVPPLVGLLNGDDDPRMTQAVEYLRAWDFRVTPDSVAAALFNGFFPRWCRAVLEERLSPELAAFAAVNAGGVASALLAGDEVGWFARTDRRAAARSVLRATLDALTSRLGPDMAGWAWGRLHTLVQKHFLSGRGDLGLLLDRSGVPAPGDAGTVCSTTADTNHAAHMGASYRMVADLADSRRGLWAVSIPGVSGHPGSPHYGDQVAAWAKGDLHFLPLDEVSASWPTLTLEPAS